MVYVPDLLLFFLIHLFTAAAGWLEIKEEKTSTQPPSRKRWNSSASRRKGQTGEIKGQPGPRSSPPRRFSFLVIGQ